MHQNLVKADPVFTVVITCYNDGQFLDEAVQSVLNSSFRQTEIIIVDDCSADRLTKTKLDELEKSGNRVIRLTVNKGVGNARNTGIEEAKGRYILTLDGDDRIRPLYLEKAALKLDEGFDVVYCNVQRFGTSDTIRVAPGFSLPLLLAGNFISSCSAFRKSMWEKTGGYDLQMLNYEDWEFWVHIAINNGRFCHLNEILFEYRARENSKIKRVQDPENRAKVVSYVCQKHAEAYRKYATEIIPYLHKIIAAAENDLSEQAVMLGGENSVSLLSKLRYAEDELKRKTEYYENSFFWKLKKISDKLRGK